MGRPDHYDDYEGMTEILPGIFVDKEQIVFVDDEGEITAWTVDEIIEDQDGEVFPCIINAVALAAKLGADKVRENIVCKGAILKEMIRKNKR